MTPPQIARRGPSTTDARCTGCPGVMILWANRAAHLAWHAAQPTTAAPSAPVGVPLAGWSHRLPDVTVETNPAKNGTANGGVPYARRFANQARYDDTSTPVAAFYGTGYVAIVASDSSPLYRMPGDHPTQPVTWVSGGNDAPREWAAGLQDKLAAVPVPTGPNGERFETHYGRSLEAAGTDKQLTIYKPSTGEMWEFWDFSWNATKGRYECGYAGYVPDVTTSGMALPNNWGARATSLPLVGGIILQEEYAAGICAHPLVVALPVIKDGPLPPATRQDGRLVAAVKNNDARDAVPEGAWFRLPASFVVDMSKPKLWQIIVTAARDYGIIVADQTGGSVTFSAEAPNAAGTPYSTLAAPALPRQTNDSDGPYWGKTGVLNSFPWERLEQVHYPLA